MAISLVPVDRQIVEDGGIGALFRNPPSQVSQIQALGKRGQQPSLRQHVVAAARIARLLSQPVGDQVLRRREEHFGIAGLVDHHEPERFTSVRPSNRGPVTNSTPIRLSG